jgi:hypothetical protein
MAEMYLEGLRTRVADQWKKLGKQPVHKVKERLKKEDISQALKKAKEEREKYIKKNPQEQISLKEEISAIKKIVEEKKKKGKKTNAVEVKIAAIEEKLKPFKGQVNANDAKGIKEELSKLKKEAEDV